MILRRDHDGVDVLSGEHLAEVRVHGASRVSIFRIDDALGLLPAIFIRVAYRDDAAAGQAQKGIHIGLAHASDADAPEGDLLAGGNSAPCGGRNETGQRNRGGGAALILMATHLLLFSQYPVEMTDAGTALFLGTAFDRQYSLETRLAQDLYYPFPIQDTFSAGTP